MSKWLSTHVATLTFSALTLIIALFIPILTHAAQVTVSWDSNDPVPDGYLVYHRTEGQAYDYSQPCWTGYGTSGTIDGLEENTTYYFVVRAFVGVQKSDDSDEVKFINGAPSSILEAMEFDDVQINHTWTRINFNQPFVNPVVVAGPISLNGGQPAVIRIRNVDATGFEIRIQEWDYLDGWHATETVSYLVMEQGHYTLENGTKIEAVNLEAIAAPRFKQVGFNGEFNVSPIVMTSVTSFNDSDAVTGRTRQITIDGFEYRMQEQEANTQDHGAERLSYIAWEPSAGAVGGTTYVVETAADAVTHQICGIMFEEPFSSAPILLADMQTSDGGNTANVRCDNKDDLSIDVWIDEEQSLDTEVSHGSEVIGYMAFSH